MSTETALYPTISPIPGGHVTGCAACGLVVAGGTVGQTASAFSEHVGEAHSLSATAAREADRLRARGPGSALAARALAMLAVIAQEARTPESDAWGLVAASPWPAERVAEWAVRTARECTEDDDALRDSLGRVETAARLRMRMP